MFGRGTSGGLFGSRPQDDRRSWEAARAELKSKKPEDLYNTVEISNVLEFYLKKYSDLIPNTSSANQISILSNLVASYDAEIKVLEDLSKNSEKDELKDQKLKESENKITRLLLAYSEMLPFAQGYQDLPIIDVEVLLSFVQNSEVVMLICSISQNLKHFIADSVSQTKSYKQFFVTMNYYLKPFYDFQLKLLQSGNYQNIVKKMRSVDSSSLNELQQEIKSIASLEFNQAYKELFDLLTKSTKEHVVNRGKADFDFLVLNGSEKSLKKVPLLLLPVFNFFTFYISIEGKYQNYNNKDYPKFLVSEIKASISVLDKDAESDDISDELEYLLAHFKNLDFCLSLFNLCFVGEGSVMRTFETIFEQILPFQIGGLVQSQNQSESFLANWAEKAKKFYQNYYKDFNKIDEEIYHIRTSLDEKIPNSKMAENIFVTLIKLAQGIKQFLVQSQRYLNAENFFQAFDEFNQKVIETFKEFHPARHYVSSQVLKSIFDLFKQANKERRGYLFGSDANRSPTFRKTFVETIEKFVLWAYSTDFATEVKALKEKRLLQRSVELFFEYSLNYLEEVILGEGLFMANDFIQIDFSKILFAKKVVERKDIELIGIQKLFIYYYCLAVTCFLSFDSSATLVTFIKFMENLTKDDEFCVKLIKFKSGLRKKLDNNKSRYIATNDDFWSQVYLKMLNKNVFDIEKSLDDNYLMELNRQLENSSDTTITLISLKTQAEEFMNQFLRLFETLDQNYAEQNHLNYDPELLEKSKSKVQNFVQRISIIRLILIRNDYNFGLINYVNPEPEYDFLSKFCRKLLSFDSLHVLDKKSLEAIEYFFTSMHLKFTQELENIYFSNFEFMINLGVNEFKSNTENDSSIIDLKFFVTENNVSGSLFGAKKHVSENQLNSESQVSSETKEEKSASSNSEKIFETSPLMAKSLIKVQILRSLIKNKPLIEKEENVDKKKHEENLQRIRSNVVEYQNQKIYYYIRNMKFESNFEKIMLDYKLEKATFDHSYLAEHMISLNKKLSEIIEKNDVFDVINYFSSILKIEEYILANHWVSKSLADSEKYVEQKFETQNNLQKFVNQLLENENAILNENKAENVEKIKGLIKSSVENFAKCIIAATVSPSSESILSALKFVAKLTESNEDIKKKLSNDLLLLNSYIDRALKLKFIELTETFIGQMKYSSSTKAIEGEKNDEEKGETGLFSAKVRKLEKARTPELKEIEEQFIKATIDLLLTKTAMEILVHNNFHWESLNDETSFFKSQGQIFYEIIQLKPKNFDHEEKLRALYRTVSHFYTLNYFSELKLEAETNKKLLTEISKLIDSCANYAEKSDKDLITPMEISRIIKNSISGFKLVIKKWASSLEKIKISNDFDDSDLPLLVEVFQKILLFSFRFDLNKNDRYEDGFEFFALTMMLFTSDNAKIEALCSNEQILNFFMNNLPTSTFATFEYIISHSFDIDFIIEAKLKALVYLDNTGYSLFRDISIRNLQIFFNKQLTDISKELFVFKENESKIVTEKIFTLKNMNDNFTSIHGISTFEYISKGPAEIAKKIITAIVDNVVSSNSETNNLMLAGLIRSYPEIAFTVANHIVKPKLDENLASNKSEEKSFLKYLICDYTSLKESISIILAFICEDSSRLLYGVDKETYFQSSYFYLLIFRELQNSKSDEKILADFWSKYENLITEIFASKSTLKKSQELKNDFALWLSSLFYLAVIESTTEAKKLEYVSIMNRFIESKLKSNCSDLNKKDFKIQELEKKDIFWINLAKNKNFYVPDFNSAVWKALEESRENFKTENIPEKKMNISKESVLEIITAIHKHNLVDFNLHKNYNSAYRELATQSSGLFSTKIVNQSCLHSYFFKLNPFLLTGPNLLSQRLKKLGVIDTKYRKFSKFVKYSVIFLENNSKPKSSKISEDENLEISRLKKVFDELGPKSLAKLNKSLTKNMVLIKSMLNEFYENSLLESFNTLLQQGAEFSSFLESKIIGKQNLEFFNKFNDKNKLLVLALASPDFLSTLGSKYIDQSKLIRQTITNLQANDPYRQAPGRRPPRRPEITALTSTASEKEESSTINDNLSQVNLFVKQKFNDSHKKNEKESPEIVEIKKAESDNELNVEEPEDYDYESSSDGSFVDQSDIEENPLYNPSSQKKKIQSTLVQSIQEESSRFQTGGLFGSSAAFIGQQTRLDARNVSQSPIDFISFKASFETGMGIIDVPKYMKEFSEAFSNTEQKLKVERDETASSEINPQAYSKFFDSVDIFFDMLLDQMKTIKAIDINGKYIMQLLADQNSQLLVSTIVLKILDKKVIERGIGTQSSLLRISFEFALRTPEYFFQKLSSKIFERYLENLSCKLDNDFTLFEILVTYFQNIILENDGELFKYYYFLIEALQVHYNKAMKNKSPFFEKDYFNVLLDLAKIEDLEWPQYKLKSYTNLLCLIILDQKDVSLDLGLESLYIIFEKIYPKDLEYIDNIIQIEQGTDERLQLVGEPEIRINILIKLLNDLRFHPDISEKLFFYFLERIEFWSKLKYICFNYSKLLNIMIRQNMHGFGGFGMNYQHHPYLKDVINPLLNMLTIVDAFSKSFAKDQTKSMILNKKIDIKNSEIMFEGISDLNGSFVDNLTRWLTKNRQKMSSYFGQDGLNSIEDQQMYFDTIKNYPVIFDLPAKRDFIKSKIKQKIPQNTTNSWSGFSRQLTVDRKKIIEDTLKHFDDPSFNKFSFNVTFIDEAGIDAGGLKKEFYTAITKELFSPALGLFRDCESFNAIEINPSSSLQPNCLKHFELAGNIVGLVILAYSLYFKAFFENIALSVDFCQAILKHILKLDITAEDLKELEKVEAGSLAWIEQNDPMVLEENFTKSLTILGTTLEIELKKGGKDIKLTEENKLEFIKLWIEQRTVKDVKKQLEAFEKGFFEIVPEEYVTIFSLSELQLLISGQKTVDVKDMKLFMKFEHLHEKPQMKEWLFKILDEFSQKELNQLVRFATGN